MARRPPTGDGAPRRPLWVLALLGILFTAWMSMVPNAGAVGRPDDAVTPGTGRAFGETATW